MIKVKFVKVDVYALTFNTSVKGGVASAGDGKLCRTDPYLLISLD